MLNTQHFTLLAGNPQKWDTAILNAVQNGSSLVQMQERQHGEGRRSAELVKTIYGYGVRSASGLDNFAILLSSRNTSRAEAIAWGTKWANEDPDNREFYAHKDI